MPGLCLALQSLPHGTALLPPLGLPSILSSPPSSNGPSSFPPPRFVHSTALAIQSGVVNGAVAVIRDYALAFIREFVRGRERRRRRRNGEREGGTSGGKKVEDGNPSEQIERREEKEYFRKKEEEMEGFRPPIVFTGGDASLLFAAVTVREREEEEDDDDDDDEEEEERRQVVTNLHDTTGNTIDRKNSVNDRNQCNNSHKLNFILQGDVGFHGLHSVAVAHGLLPPALGKITSLPARVVSTVGGGEGREEGVCERG